MNLFNKKRETPTKNMFGFIRTNKKKSKKPSKAKLFLAGLYSAVEYKTDKTAFQKRFSKILIKADESVAKSKLKKAGKVTLEDVIETLKYKSTDKLDELKKLPVTRFEKFVFKLKYNWAIIKEFGNLIKNWFIAEYRIIRKLTYALSRKKDEVRIRKAMESNMTNMVNKYGYDKGMQMHHKIAFDINNSLKLHKRVEKIHR